MKRREFIALLGGAAAAWPVVVRAQQGERRHRIAVLLGGLTPDEHRGRAQVIAFEGGLKQAGWNIRDNIEVTYWWPGASPDRVRAAASEIVAMRPDLVVSRSTPATAALMDTNLPVVFVGVADPISSGFIKSYAKPGGNLTGFSNLEPSVGGKWLQILKEVAPKVSTASMLFNPVTAPYTEAYMRFAQPAARTLGVRLVSAPCSGVTEIESNIAAAARGGDGGIIVVPDTTLAAHRALIIELTAQHQLPAIYGVEFYVPSGGLIAYAIDFTDIFRRAANYVDQILKGAKPADLPVQLPTRFALMVNLKTAKTLGLTIPQTLLATTDEVIE
jgi:putative ABC transport system substrate-binding protein